MHCTMKSRMPAFGRPRSQNEIPGEEHARVVAHQRVIDFALLTILGFGVCILFVTRSSSHASDQIEAKVERLDPAANEIIPEPLQLKKLAGGFKWTEGPIWIPEGYLLFAEIPSN